MIWKEISTAPLDGASIVVTSFDFPHRTGQVAFFKHGEWWLDNGAGQHIESDEGDYWLSVEFAPTHWCPLPGAGIANHQNHSAPFE